MFPTALQEKMVNRYPSLYEWKSGGFASLKIAGGRIEVGELTGPGLGCDLPISPEERGDPGMPRPESESHS
jgi:hypothetical protein